MRPTYCKFIGCPRLVAAKTERGKRNFAQCNQQMRDGAVWFADCESVSGRQCLELQRELRARTEKKA